MADTRDQSSDRKSSKASPSTIYLIFYNVSQTLGWCWLMASMIYHLVKYETHIGVYNSVEIPLKIFQTAALMEVVHCALGLVPSSVMLTAFQVASRLFLTWFVTHSVKEVQDTVGVPVFLLAWTVTEIIRYSFYTCSLVNMLPYTIQWCRYTLFIILYPIGVTGELLVIYSALSHVKTSGLYSLTLPNQTNFSFSYYFFLIFIMASYIPIFPQLYFHMFRQRRKVIGSKAKKLQ